MLGGLDLGGPGIQEPGAGLMGSGYIKVGGTLDKINLQGLGVTGGECIALHRR